MIRLVRGGAVLAPQPLGIKDILILDRKIAAVADPGRIRVEGIEVAVVEAEGKTVLPGLIDTHVHLLGGGGEGGPTTRAPEITLDDIISSGVTTVVGCLGTDGTTRHMTSLLAKARALDTEGISTCIFVGSYEIPVVTITASVRSDLILIDKVIGAGEIALSDHRSSQPTFEDFSRLAAECRVGGMLGGKPGILHCHMGAGPRKLEMLFRLVQDTEIPISQVIPTHVNRNPELLAEGIAFIRQGGFIDLTADEDPEVESEGHMSIASALRQCLENQADLSHITISSDSNGSLPVFDAQGNLEGLTIATQKSLLNNLRHLVEKHILKLEEAVRLWTANPASFYKFTQKGAISPGRDADLILLDEALNLTDVFARGRPMMADGQLLVRGTFAKA